MCLVVQENYLYEDPEWENGSFTKAIKEAFENKEVNGKNGLIAADQNGDGILYMNELYDFLHERVPAIVRTKRPKLSSLQHPFMPKNQLNQSKPIFVIR